MIMHLHHSTVISYSSNRMHSAMHTFRYFFFHSLSFHSSSPFSFWKTNLHGLEMRQNENVKFSRNFHKKTILVHHSCLVSNTDTSSWIKFALNSELICPNLLYKSEKRETERKRARKNEWKKEILMLVSTILVSHATKSCINSQMKWNGNQLVLIYNFPSGDNSRYGIFLFISISFRVFDLYCFE